TELTSTIGVGLAAPWTGDDRISRMSLGSNCRVSLAAEAISAECALDLMCGQNMTGWSRYGAPWDLSGSTVLVGEVSAFDPPPQGLAMLAFFDVGDLVTAGPLGAYARDDWESRADSSTPDSGRWGRYEFPSAALNDRSKGGTLYFAEVSERREALIH